MRIQEPDPLEQSAGFETGHASVLHRASLHRMIILALLLLGGCKAPSPEMKSVCDLPPHIASWGGSQVRWKGAIAGTFQHGFSLSAEECQRRGIGLDGFDTAIGGAAFERALRDTAQKTGVLRAELSGKIIATPGRERLYVTAVHQFRFQPMTRDEWEAYWRAQGF